MSNPYQPDPYSSSSSYDPYSQQPDTYPQYSQPSDPYPPSVPAANPYGQYSQPPLYAQPVQPVYVQPVIVGQPTNGKATAAMILGLLVFVTWFVTGIPAVILGHMALGEINASGGAQGGRGQAITGLVLGYLSLGTLVCICLYFVLIAASAGGSPS
ncbi:MAG TPA: DUF4190 domain-containing protein [Ktedonobacterales bacterium]|nr:DUF4190 domain-containing protein [Ktedonobacterales bacterium]